MQQCNKLKLATAAIEKVLDERGLYAPAGTLAEVALNAVNTAVKPGASYWLNCAKEQLSVINDSVFELKGKAISVDRQYVLLARIIGATEGAIQRISEHEEKAR